MGEQPATGPWVKYIGAPGERGVSPEPGDRGRVVRRGKGRDRGLTLVAWLLRAPPPGRCLRPGGWQRTWVPDADLRELGDG